MALLSKYGTLWGQVPSTSGRVFWVAPSSTYTVDGRAYPASDNNDGLSPERALLTLAQAITNATASVGDIIVLLNGAHSWTASVAASKAGITIMGLPNSYLGVPGWRQTSITVSAADEIINVTAADVEIAYLRPITVTAQRGIDFTAAGDRLYIHHCSFDQYTAAASTSTISVSATAATINADRLWVTDCVFENSGAQGPAIFVGDSNTYVIENNKFIHYTGTWAKACEASGVTNQSGVWLNNKWLTVGTGTIGTGIEGSALANTGAVGAIGNFFSFATTIAFDTFGAGTLYIAENYKANTGAASGGALVTAIT